MDFLCKIHMVGKQSFRRMEGVSIPWKLVRGRGLEPLRIAPLEPKSSASAISPPARKADQSFRAAIADSLSLQILNTEEKPLMSKISLTLSWSA